MSGAKLPPRQKMIGMMYLVLTALLALNVSKDILNAFLLVNDGLESTIITLSKNNATLYGEFDKAKSIDKVKVIPYWEKAQQIKSKTKSLISYIDSLKILLIKETEGLESSIADTIALKNVSAKDNYDVPTHIMIGDSDDGSKGLGIKLKKRIEDYRSFLVSSLPKDIVSTINLGLNTEEVNSFNEKVSWERGNFYHTPLAACITILSKIQSDIKNAEYQSINTLFSYVRKNDFTFDTIAPKIIAKSNYVLLGDEYESDIFMAAYSTTQNPEIIIGKLDSLGNLIQAYDTIKAKNGFGKYKIKPTSEGIYDYEGIIKVTSPNGNKKVMPFKSSFVAAKPNLVVSADAMNVLYIGPENPISISVPGISSDKISATINGMGNKLIKLNNGKYKAVLSNASPKNVNVTVHAQMPDGSSKTMGSISFKVKKLPKPYASFSGVSGSSSLPLSQLKYAETLKVTYGENFVFTGLRIDVVSFKVMVIRSNEIKLEEKNSSFNKSKINSKTKSFFQNNLKRGDVIYIEDIIAKDVSGQNVPTAGLIKIKVR